MRARWRPGPAAVRPAFLIAGALIPRDRPRRDAAGPGAGRSRPCDESGQVAVVGVTAPGGRSRTVRNAPAVSRTIRTHDLAAAGTAGVYADRVSGRAFGPPETIRRSDSLRDHVSETKKSRPGQGVRTGRYRESLQLGARTQGAAEAILATAGACTFHGRVLGRLKRAAIVAQSPDRRARRKPGRIRGESAVSIDTAVAR